MITDWSGISAEYCFATERPAVFINTKIKANNPNWEKLEITPVEIKFRNELGVNVNKEDLDKIGDIVANLFENGAHYKEKINEYFKAFTFNHNSAAEVGAKYVLETILNKKKNKSDKNSNK